MVQDADGKLWCERCDAVAPKAGEGVLVKCCGLYHDLNKNGWGIVSFALCSKCAREFAAELTKPNGE